jgi:hypothetical protein
VKNKLKKQQNKTLTCFFCILAVFATFAQKSQKPMEQKHTNGGP